MILLDPDARPVVAHRGASAAFPENTLLALREGLRQGADALELDVRLSGDGVPVVIHDATLGRTTNGMGAVRARSFADLQQLDAGEGEPIPSLGQVLETFSDTPLIIELKDVACARPVAELLRHMGVTRRVVLGSFAHEAMRRIPVPPFACSASRRETVAFWTASRVLTPWWPGRYAVLTVPEYRGRLRVVDRRLIGLARRVGKPVHVWTVDDPSRAVELWGIGVQGIITNAPDRIRKGVGVAPDRPSGEITS